MKRRGWSIQVATPFGIPVRVHLSLIILVVWLSAFSAPLGGHPGLSIVFLVMVFACLCLHELGHALMARRFGVSTKEIVLYPIGGVARLDSMPTGVAELLIAFAGPFVNLVLALFFLVVALIQGTGLVPGEGASAASTLVSLLFFANVMLFVFNLLPAFPMDGGRILRASLSLFLPLDRATRWAAGIGQLFAGMMALAAFVMASVSPENLPRSLILLLIAGFVFTGAAQENAYYRTLSWVRGRRAREAMETRFERLAPQDSLDYATRLALGSQQRDFPVVNAWGRVVGILDRSRLLGALAEHGQDAAVLEIMDREVVSVVEETDLEEVLRQLQRQRASTIVVQGETAPVGLLTLEKILFFIEVCQGLHRAAPRAPHEPDGDVR